MANNSSNRLDDLIQKSFNINPESLLLLNIKGQIIKVNTQTEILSGYKAKEIVGKSVFQLPFLPKESIKIIKHNFFKRLSGKTVNDYDVIIKTRSGKELIGSILGQIVKNAKGFPIGSIITVQNVTEQRKLVNKLKKLNKKIENYLNVSNSLVVVLNPKLEIQLINKMGLKLLGYKHDELYGKNWIETVIQKEDQANLKKICLKLLNKTGHNIIENIVEITTKNGTKRLIKFRSSVLRDDNKKIIEIVNSGQDITDEHKFAKSLEETEKMLSLVMLHSSEVYYINSIKYGRLDYVSEQCIKMMGYTPDELKKNWTRVLSNSPINKNVLENTKKAIKTGEKQPLYLMEIKTKKGVIKMTEVDETPVKDKSGKVTGLSGVVRDISKRFEIESELQKRVNQLERINKIVINRELKMIELKKTIATLQNKLTKVKL